MAPQQTANWAEGYDTVDANTPPSITWASTGGDGSGKSHFALTAPGPIFVAAFDPYGMNRVSPDVKRDKQIAIARYPFDPLDKKFQDKQGRIDREAVKDAAEKLWGKFRADYDHFLTRAKTVVFDREDLMYELQRYSRFGAQNDAPKEYGPLYIEYGWLVQLATAHNVNLGLLRGLRDKWISKFDATKQKMVGHNTGEKIADGMNKVADLVDITIDHRWSSEDKAFMAKIGKFPNSEYRDQEVPDLTFSSMATAAYPTTSVEDWE